MSRPSTTESNGRGGDGRFGAGNKFAKGNPHAQRVARLRCVFLDAVTENDMRSAVKAVVDQAKNGDLDAAKLLFDRVFGKVSEPVDPDHVEVDGMQLESRARALESMNRPMPTTAAEILRG